MRRVWLVVFLFVVSGCSDGRSLEKTARPTAPATAVQVGRVTPTAKPSPTHVATATGTPSATPSSTPTRRPTRTPSPTPTPPPPTGTLLLAGTPVAKPGSVLVYTEWLDGQIALAQVDVEGRIHLVSEPGRAPNQAWYSHSLGAWMAYDVEWEDGHQVRVVLYNSRTGLRQEIPIPYGVSVWGPAVDAGGGRVAYTLLADLLEHVDGTHRWVTYVHDLSSGTVMGFGAEWPTPQDTSFFGGQPIAWVGDTLLIEMFSPSGEGYLGVWALDTSRGIPSETVTLQRYDRLVLDSAAAPATGLYHGPTLSPDGELLAFLIQDSQDSAYDLPCWHSASSEEHLTAALGAVPIWGGTPRLLVVAEQDRDLAEPVAWSPDSRQILFIEGPCQEEPSPVVLTLRTVDLEGAVTGEWPLPPRDPPVWLRTLWCTSDGIFYGYTFGRNEQSELWHLDLATGLSVLVGKELWLAGCIP